MNKQTILAIATGGLLASLTVTGVAAEERGAGLFEYHGCVGCHGPRGIAPVDDIVPELGGKKAEYLYKEAQAILSGKRTHKHAALMHAAFYSPSNCDSPPTNAELRDITAWLSRQ